ncbi:MAG: glycosyltransferase [Nanoarchaeota archaeon]
MNNVLIVSLNPGGTMGHGRIVTSLSNNLIKYKKKVTLVSETNYAYFFNIDKKVNQIILPKSKHVPTLGGMYKYIQKNKILDICEKKNINCIIFSTFFDLELVKEIKKKRIKTILLSYPIRDTFRKALIFNKTYNSFDKIVSLYDPSTNEEKLKNEIIVNPLKTVLTIPENRQKIDILLTCGGGGRYSAKVFINKTVDALKLIFKEKENLRVTFIKGNSKTKNMLSKINLIRWSKKFEELIASSKIVISEAGYFTMLDLINNNKSAILIPGIRRIDNQELRALTLENLGLGKVFFPFEKKQKLTELIKGSLKNSDKNNSKFIAIKRKFNKYAELTSVIQRELI